MISGTNRVGFRSGNSVRREGGAGPVDFVIASLGRKRLGAKTIPSTEEFSQGPPEHRLGQLPASGASKWTVDPAGRTRQFAT